MNRTFGVPCSNCGGSATRNYFTSKESRYNACPQNQIIQVECADCDYLMVMCSVNGNIVEAYSSGIPVLATKTLVR